VQPTQRPLRSRQRNRISADAQKGAAILDVPNCNYATSASFGRFGLQAWANWQPLRAQPRTGYATPASTDEVPFTGVRTRTIRTRAHPATIRARKRVHPRSPANAHHHLAESQEVGAFHQVSREAHPPVDERRRQEERGLRLPEEAIGAVEIT